MTPTCQPTKFATTWYIYYT